MKRIAKKSSSISAKSNDDMLHSLFEHAISGILFGNPDNGKILEANPAAAKMFDYTINELRKLNRNDIFDFKHHSVVNSLKKRQENAAAKGELIGIRKNGERFPCEFSSSIFKNEIGENRTSTILNDISERKKAEEEMNLLMNNTEESFVLIDKQHNIISFNRQFKVYYEAMFNKNISKGDSILNLTQKGRKKIVKQIYKKVFCGQIVDDEIIIPRKNQADTIFFVRYKPALDCSGNVIGAFVTARDITEKRITQLKLKNSAELFEKLTYKIPTAIYQFEISVEGKMYFPYFSKGIKKINPYIDLELLKHDASSAFEKAHPEDMEKIFSSIELSKNNLTDWELEYRIILDDGKIVWVKGCSSPEKKANGTIVWYGYLQDITEEKNRKLERELIMSELSQNNKDLKQFSYVTSHNLRAPIANLLGLTNLIDHYKVEDSSLKQVLEGIKKSALMFDETIKDLSKVLIIKDQSNALKDQVSLEMIASKTLMQLGINLNDRDVNITYDFVKAPCVTFTGSYLESVFMNLFTNSIKYKSSKRKLKIDISSNTVGDFVILKYKDNGIGIDIDKHKDKIFKLYQRFHDNPEGKGLGLYLVKSQIEALGGSVSVESEVDKGTTFTLRFKNED